ncbi:MAG: sulfatase-like hydrolase/transferase [Acidobacteria bacterium]|nr:sulfatase-like hydrolase/transferase [Acidobacteriota bacterium]
MLSAGLASSFAGLVRGQTPQRPKNVLIVMTDQHRPQALGVNGDPYARTPNLDSLARSGVRFRSAYCTNPVCVPSRMSLLTGLYTHHHGTVDNTRPLPFAVPTMAHAFNRSGYMTGLIGKMHFVDAQTHGFDYRLDFNDWAQYLGPKFKVYADELGRANSGSGVPQIDDLWKDSGDPWMGAREVDGRESSVHVGRVSKLPERDHFESFVARESIRFLRNHGRRQPFLLITSFLKPPAGRCARVCRPEDMRLPASWVEGVRHNATPEMRDPNNARIRMAMYYACLAQMDDCAGQVLNELNNLGLADDTIVLYTSDHGEMLGEHGLWTKMVFYEPSVGVPLLVRAPGVTRPGGVSSTPVSQVQILPTLSELCGVRETTVFAEFNLGKPNAMYMIRRGDFKLNLYAGRQPELFNLKQDPGEIRNIVALPESQAIRRTLGRALYAWHRPPEAGFPEEIQ